MPLTAITMLTSSILMLLSWLFITHRLNADAQGGSYQAQLMSKYFLNIGIFCLFLFAPHMLLNRYPEHFGIAMAVAYVVGHIFCYIAFIYILRLTFSIVPRLSGKETIAVWVAGIAAAGLTVFNAVTMVGGTRPEFSYAKEVTLFHAHPVVGAGIAIFAAVCCVPFAILMIINGFTHPGARLRSFLLGGGFLVGMVAGPLHDNATTANIYMLADLITIVSVVITTSGVLYRIEEKIALPQRAAAGSHA